MDHEDKREATCESSIEVDHNESLKIINTEIVMTLRDLFIHSRHIIAQDAKLLTFNIITTNVSIFLCKMARYFVQTNLANIGGKHNLRLEPSSFSLNEVTR